MSSSLTSVGVMTMCTGVVHVALLKLKLLILCVLLNAVTGGTHVEFTASPHEVQYPVTSTLTLRCDLLSTVTSVNPVTSSPSQVIGKRSSDNNEAIIQRRSSEEEDIEHVTSITISRNGVVVSSVTLYTPAKVETQLDLANVKVDGDIKVNAINNGGSTEKGHLQLDWSFPLRGQTGSYECAVSGVTAGGHQVTATRELEVEATTVDLDDMLAEIHDLKKQVLDQRNVTEAQQREIDSEKSRNDRQQSVIDQQQHINDQQQTALSQQQATIDSLTKELHRVGHVEHGLTDCGPSSSWTDGDYQTPWSHSGHMARTKAVRVDFKAPFVKPPVVQLSIYSHFNDNDPKEEQAVIVEKVDPSGFTLRCMTWTGNTVFDLDLSWIAVASA